MLLPAKTTTTQRRYEGIMSKDEGEVRSLGGGGASAKMAAVNPAIYDDVIPKFSGADKTYTVSRWIQDIEDHGEIFEWSPLQKLIIARRSLCSTAELWLKTEKTFKTFEDLKLSIAKEFPETINSKEIHEIMSTRKKRKDESCYEYMLAMKELGKRGKLADYVAIEYIIEGIPDYDSNKIMLFGVTTYSELKVALETITDLIPTLLQDQQGIVRNYNA